ncbi:MAG: hypothetical protein HOI23_15415 [Deltaproteobacteria bacterium]|jgi:hypothetical protein|nr:hypothetical protein [Deltaproteobacteria bacterium]MBT6435781.1 hypothetical protein [Deltaproteobacteria bacterium]
MRLIVCLSIISTIHLFGCAGSEPCVYSETTGYGSDCSIDDNASSVTLNEFSSKGDDFVEIYNQGDSQVDIGGWILTDDVEVGKIDNYDPAADLEKFVFPAGTVIAGQAFLAIPKGAEGIAHPFGISSKGDTVTLVASNGQLIDQGQAADGQSRPSYCRIPDGTGNWEVCELTAGSANQAVQCGNGTVDATEECDGTDLGGKSCSDLAESYTGGSLTCSSSCTLIRTGCETSALCQSGVVLNEVCHKNSLCGVVGTTTGDWLELYNDSDETVSISGCSIQVSEGGSMQSKTLIAHIKDMENLELSPGAYLVINDVEELFDAGNDAFVSLLGENEEAINSLTTSSALSVDGDPQSDACSIDEGTSAASPSSTNQCVGL